MELFSDLCILTVVAFGFALIALVRGRMPPPGLTAFRTALAIVAVVGGLLGSERGAILGAALVLIGLAVRWGVKRRASRPLSRTLGRVAAGACVVIGFLVLIGGRNPFEPAPPGGWLDYDTLQQVHAGMSREQVETVVGPPRDAWHGDRVVFYATSYLQRGYELWTGSGSGLLVLFDENGRAVDVALVPAFPASPPSWAERLARR